MKRKFLTAMVATVAMLLVGAFVAQAADFKFGGRLRPRYELWERFNNHNVSGFINMLARLNVNVNIDEKTSAFFQLQSNSRFGTNGTPTATCTGCAPGSTIALTGLGGGSNLSNPTSPNDTKTDVGMHQVYFVLKNFANLPVDFQVGRQEVVLDGHRLFGNTVWNQGMQSHDAIRVTHKHDKMTALFVFSKAAENTAQGIAGKFAGTSQDDTADNDAYILWLNYQGLTDDKSSTSGYLVFIDQEQNNMILGFNHRIVMRNNNFVATNNCPDGAASGKLDILYRPPDHFRGSIITVRYSFNCLCGTTSK